MSDSSSEVSWDGPLSGPGWPFPANFVREPSEAASTGAVSPASAPRPVHPPAGHALSREVEDHHPAALALVRLLRAAIAARGRAWLRLWKRRARFLRLMSQLYAGRLLPLRIRQLEVYACVVEFL